MNTKDVLATQYLEFFVSKALKHLGANDAICVFGERGLLELAALKSENERLREALKCVVERFDAMEKADLENDCDGGHDHWVIMRAAEITSWRALLSPQPATK